MDSNKLYKWLKDLFPINRSLSGKGTRDTLAYMQKIIPELKISEIPSGSKVFDWTVPDEWNVTEAYIEASDGTRIVDFRNNNLHLVGYSEPVNQVITKSELLKHLYWIPNQPNDIPYVTSYYSRTWGFCLTVQQLELLGDGPFRVFIDSSFKSKFDGGSLSFGEIFLPGKSEKEILFSTYICHPSMANNELSGPVIALALVDHLKKLDHHYSFRFLFLPETIGSIYYISENLDRLKKDLIAGWVLTCLGDSGTFSYIPSRLGNNYADRLSKTILSQEYPDFKNYSWLDRGSDERQYCSPFIDLPVCSITRSKYGTYPQYHTSADDLTFVSAKALMESYKLFTSLIEKIESQRVPVINTYCEPQLGIRGLYPNLSNREAYGVDIQNLVNVISYLDGNHTIAEIASKCRIEISETNKILELLSNHKLIIQ